MNRPALLEEVRHYFADSDQWHRFVRGIARSRPPRQSPSRLCGNIGAPGLHRSYYGRLFRESRMAIQPQDRPYVAQGRHGKPARDRAGGQTPLRLQLVLPERRGAATIGWRRIGLQPAGLESLVYQPVLPPIWLSGSRCRGEKRATNLLQIRSLPEGIGVSGQADHLPHAH